MSKTESARKWKCQKQKKSEKESVIMLIAEKCLKLSVRKFWKLKVSKTICARKCKRQKLKVLETEIERKRIIFRKRKCQHTYS